MRKALLLFLGVFGVACSESESPSPGVQLVAVEAPAAFGGTVPYPERNPFSEAGISLGRQLFFDKRLSGNNQLACASCHLPQLAFTDGIPLSSIGVGGNPLARHAPPLFNLAWAKNGLFWDGGASDLESLSFAPLQHPDEMGQDIAELLEELRVVEEYRNLFREAFGADTLHSALVVRALAQYQRTLVSANSRYDRIVTGTSDETFSEAELRGKQLFEQKCTSCHLPPFFTDFGFHNNGLDNSFPTEPEHPAQGRFRITLNPADMGKFKTPSLRNLAFTAPYMHDGRFATLEAVLDHYDNGMKDSETLEAVFRQESGDLGVALTAQHKADLLAFLQTLNDSSFVEKH